jgi:hypothetical protein
MKEQLENLKDKIIFDDIPELSENSDDGIGIDDIESQSSLDLSDDETYVIQKINPLDTDIQKEIQRVNDFADKTEVKYVLQDIVDEVVVENEGSRTPSPTLSDSELEDNGCSASLWR